MTTWDNSNFTQYIKPPGAYPEGWDLPQYLNTLLYRIGVLPYQGGYGAQPQRYYLLDMFCGKGRCCTCIEPMLYHGVDINGGAIDMARTAHPHYSFSRIDAEAVSKWYAHCVLLWTALTMLDDAEALTFLRKIDARYIIIGDICGRIWRNPGGAGHPPIYNREFTDVIDMAVQAGYSLMIHEQQPHEHYSGNAMWAGRDTSIHTFVFQRADDWQFYREAHGKVQSGKGEPCQM